MINIDVGAITEGVFDILSKVIPDKDKAAKMSFEIATLAARNTHENNIAQTEVNKQEAQHPSIFVAGWRPFMGWVCGSAFVLNFLLFPIAEFIMRLNGIQEDVPVLDWATMGPVVMGMLGLTATRGYEKARGVARENMGEKNATNNKPTSPRGPRR